MTYLSKPARNILVLLREILKNEGFYGVQIDLICSKTGFDINMATNVLGELSNLEFIRQDHPDTADITDFGYEYDLLLDDSIIEERDAMGDITRIIFDYIISMRPSNVPIEVFIDEFGFTEKDIDETKTELYELGYPINDLITQRTPE